MLEKSFQSMQNEVERISLGLGVKTISHISCENLSWVRNLPVEKYIGIDSQENVATRLQQSFGSQKHHFQYGDITKDLLPKTDLLLCLDALNYLSQQEIRATILLFKKSGAKYLLLLNFPSTPKNKKMKKALFHPINWQNAPYFFPSPLISFDVDKLNFGLWEISSLP